MDYDIEEVEAVEVIEIRVVQEKTAIPKIPSITQSALALRDNIFREDEYYNSRCYME